MIFPPSFQYCPYFLVRFCPHDLFVNTRADLGVCPKVHDEEVRKLYEQSKPIKKLHIQEEFVRFCTAMVNDVQRKIQKGMHNKATYSCDFKYFRTFWRSAILQY